MTAQPSSKPRSVTIPSALTVKELGDLLGVSPIEVIKRLMTNGVLAALNQSIDFDTAAVVAVDLGFDPVAVEAGEPAAAPAVADEEAEAPDDPASLKPRP